jgi:hypothetical protein
VSKYRDRPYQSGRSKALDKDQEPGAPGHIAGDGYMGMIRGVRTSKDNGNGVIVASRPS